MALDNGRDDSISGIYDGYGFGMGNGAGAAGSKLQGLFSGIGWVDSGYTFSASNTWYHVVMLRSSGTTKFYVNGSQTVGTSASVPNMPTTNFAIGANRGPSGISRYFNGLIDEVRVSSSARSADWISAEYCNQSSNCAFYSTGPVNAFSGAITAVSSFTLTATWADISTPNGREVDVSTASDFSGTLFSSVTTNASMISLAAGSASPLWANTTYYARVGDINGATTTYFNTIPSELFHAG